jgi:hypothetical protein
MPVRAVQAVLVVVALILVAGAWLVATTLLAPPAPSPASTVPLPAVGQVEGVRLRDGRPVFVVHHQAGEISVLDGFATHIPYGVFKLLRWCPTARIFEDPAHGADYDEWGRRIAGPAPPGGLIAFSFRLESGARLVIGAEEGPIPVGDATHPFPTDFSDCSYLHDFSGSRHLTPAEALAQPDGSWQVVAGIVDPQFQRLCALGSGCSDTAFIADLRLQAQLDPQALNYLRSPQLWLVRVTDGRLGHLSAIVDPATD